MSAFTTRRRGSSLVLVVLILWSTFLFTDVYALTYDDEAAPQETASAGVRKPTEDVTTGGGGERGPAKVEKDAPGPRDDLVGWYRLTQRRHDPDRDDRNKDVGDIADGDTLIGVLKHGGAYYSVCRGFEIPFKPCSDGLTWALEPSSMMGTTIGFDEKADTYYIRVVDAQAMHYHEDGHAPPVNRPLTPIDAPDWLRNSSAPPPRTLDDFLGTYESVYFPYVRWSVHKYDDRYVAEYKEMREPGKWRLEGEPLDLTPLVGQRGFSGLDRKGKVHLTYNQALKRFELAMKAKSGVLRMPLAKFELPASPEDEECTHPKVRIGIPSWH